MGRQPDLEARRDGCSRKGAGHQPHLGALKRDRGAFRGPGGQVRHHAGDEGASQTGTRAPEGAGRPERVMLLR